MNRKRLLIRADAGADIGHGHVMRMLALAQAWKRKGGDVVFACASLPDSLGTLLVEKGFGVEYLSGSENVVAGGQEDADWFISIARCMDLGCAILDGYALGPQYVKRVRKIAQIPVAMMVDAEPEKNLLSEADLVVFPCADEPSAMVYEGAKLLKGRDYILLREEFLKVNERRVDMPHHRDRTEPEVDANALKLLVCLGGSDPDNATERIVRCLGAGNSSLLASLSLRIVVGASNAFIDDLLKLKEEFRVFSYFEVLADVPDMPEQLTWADCIVSATGGMVWEWMYAGLEGAVCSIAENQETNYRYLVNVMGVPGIGSLNSRDAQPEDEQLLDWLQRLLLAKRAGALIRSHGNVIDGKGADRVADALWDL